MTTSLHDYCHRGKLEKIIEKASAVPLGLWVVLTHRPSRCDPRKVGKGRNLNRQEPVSVFVLLCVLVHGGRGLVGVALVGGFVVALGPVSSSLTALQSYGVS
jgi:hypothetical protein